MNVWPYVSYEDIRDYQDIAAAITGDDVLLKQLALIANRMWDGSCGGRRFAPWLETRYYDHVDQGGSNRSARAQLAYGLNPWAAVLRLGEDLLEVVTLTTANGGTTIAAADQLLRQGRAYGRTPYDRIELKTNGTTTVFTFSDTYQQANAVAAWWGYHDDYKPAGSGGSAWVDSLDTVEGGGINASATALTVNDADGADAYGVTPRFKAQTLIRAGDELMYISAKNTTTNVLTVVRGVNGSIAAAHDADVTIYTWRVMDDVFNAVRRLAVWLYGQKDSPFFETQINQQLGTVTIPAAAPLDVRVKAQYYCRTM